MSLFFLVCIMVIYLGRKTYYSILQVALSHTTDVICCIGEQIMLLVTNSFLIICISWATG